MRNTTELRWKGRRSHWPEVTDLNRTPADVLSLASLTIVRVLLESISTQCLVQTKAVL